MGETLAAMVQAYGTCIAIGGQGVLLRGPSGSGKSDLALRLIDRGAFLVADDQTLLHRQCAEVLASCPDTIAGRIEIRGLGIFPCPSVDSAPLRLLVDLRPPAAIERLPARLTESCLGVTLPVLQLAPFEVSAPIKLCWALRAWTAAGATEQAGAECIA